MMKLMNNAVHDKAEYRQNDGQSGEEDHIATKTAEPMHPFPEPPPFHLLQRLLPRHLFPLPLSFGIFTQLFQFDRLLLGEIGQILAVLAEHDRLFVVPY